MTTWDERFREGQYPRDPEPAALLRRAVETVEPGRALDLAAGTGRNAVFLAEAGYTVDAVDQSREGLAITLERAAERGVADRVNPIQADIPSYTFPTARYDLVAVSFYRAVDRFPDVKEALVPGGLLFVEHHLRSADPTTWGPSGDRYRFAANELLHACLDCTVLAYAEGTERRPDGDDQRAVARVLARNSTGSRQSYAPILLD